MDIAKIVEKFKSKKVIAGGIALAVVIVLYLAQVFYMGVLNKRFYEEARQSLQEHQSALEKLDERFGYFSIQNESFERGFFSSKASFDVLADSVAFGAPLGAELPPISVKVEFKNNIFSSRNVVINIENPFHEMMQMFSKQAGLTLNMNKNFIVAKVNVSIFGKANIEVKIQDIDMKMSNDEYMNFKDFIITMQLDSDGKVISSHLDFGGFELKGDNELYYIKDVVSHTQFNKPASFLEAIGFEIVGFDSKSSIQSAGFRDNEGAGEILDVSFNAGLLDDNVDVFSTDVVMKAKTLTFTSVYDNETIELNDINANILTEKFPKKIYSMFLSSLYHPDITEDIMLALFDEAFNEAGTKVEISDMSFYRGANDFKAKGFMQGDKEGTQVNLTLTSSVQFSEFFSNMFFSDIELPQNNEGRYILEIIGPMSEELQFNGKSFVEFLGIDSELLDESIQGLDDEENSKVLEDTINNVPSTQALEDMAKELLEDTINNVPSTEGINPT